LDADPVTDGVTELELLREPLGVTELEAETLRDDEADIEVVILGERDGEATVDNETDFEVVIVVEGD